MTNALIEKTEEIKEKKELPQGWVECTWEDILDDDKHSMKRGPFGSSLKKEFFVEKGIRVFEQYNPINNDPHWSRYYISEEKYKELEAFTAKAGDLLISCSGTLGKILELPEDVEIGIINQALLKLRLNFNIISNEFFVYLFTAPLMQKKIFDSTTGTAIQNIVGVKELKKITLNLPPLPEQVRIVEKIEELFSNIDAGIEKLEQARLQIKQYKQSVLKSAFEGKLYKTTEWEEVKLGAVFQLINGDRGKNYPAKSKLQSTGIPFISALNIQNKTISTDKLLCVSQEQYDKLGSGKLIKGDTVLCIRGSLGKHAKYPFEKGAIASSLVILRNNKADNILSEFLSIYLDSSLMSDEIKKYNNGTAQPNLSASDLKKFLLPLPSLNEQQKIVEEIEKRFEVADILEKAVIEGLEKSKQLKQSILKKAFEGRLVPQDPSDEPASVLLEKIKAEKASITKQSKKKTKGGKNA